VQVPIALRLRVIGGMLARDLRMNEAAPSPEVHVNRQSTSDGIEPRLSHIPRRTYTQRRLKQLLRLHRYRPVPHGYRPGPNYHLPTWISKEANISYRGASAATKFEESVLGWYESPCPVGGGLERRRGCKRSARSTQRRSPACCHASIGCCSADTYRSCMARRWRSFCEARR